MLNFFAIDFILYKITEDYNASLIFWDTVYNVRLKSSHKFENIRIFIRAKSDQYIPPFQFSSVPSPIKRVRISVTTSSLVHQWSFLLF